MAATTMPNTMRMTNPGQPVREVMEVTGGVDTHADTHTAAALDQVGGLLGTATFPATPAGYQDLAGWLAGFGPLAGSGSRAPAATVPGCPGGWPQPRSRCSR